MPELWLNYGDTEIVLDIMAENLHKKIHSNCTYINDFQILEKLKLLVIDKSTQLVILNYTKSIMKIIFLLLEHFNKKSISAPNILVESKILNTLKKNYPYIKSVSEFTDFSSTSKFIFIDEIEFDGLFGFKTVSTILLKKFGENNLMLSAYEKRDGDYPSPGKETRSLKIAQKFTDVFEIQSIEIISNSSGIQDIFVGHPSFTSSILELFRSSATQKVEKHSAVIISTGNMNNTFSSSLTSLWNCNNVIQNNGLFVLLAECKNGLGSKAIRYFVQKRFNLDVLKNPIEYIDGMENLLFLKELQKKFEIGLVSALPYFYTKQLHIVQFNGVNKVISHILNSRGIKQKITVVYDGSHVLLK